MPESIRAYFQDPLILSVVWSVVGFVVVILLVLGLRKIIHSIKMEEQRRSLFKRIINNGGFVAFVVILLRIWAYQYLEHLLDPEIVTRLLPTIIGFILMILSIYILRRVIEALRIEEEKKLLYRKWASYSILFLYAIVLVRIWAGTDLFEVFKTPFVNKLYKSLLILAIVSVGLFFVRRLINAMKVDIAKKHQYRKRASYAATFIYILILIPLWAGATQQWTTILSVMGAGIALALHEVLLNIAGWVYITLRRPYKEGDRIELGDTRGDVIDIQLFQTTLLEIGNWVDGDQSTGRVVQLPHGQIFRNPLYNYTKGFEFLWNELFIMVTFESNWEKAKEILLELGENASKKIQERVKRKITRMAREYLIYYKTYTPIVYTKIEDSGVKLTLRYLTEAKTRRIIEDTINQQVLDAVSKTSDIQFAYPTYRIYRQGEGGGGRK